MNKNAKIKCEHDYYFYKEVILDSELDNAVKLGMTGATWKISAKNKHVIYFKCKKCNHLYYDTHITA